MRRSPSPVCLLSSPSGRLARRPPLSEPSRQGCHRLLLRRCRSRRESAWAPPALSRCPSPSSGLSAAASSRGGGSRGFPLPVRFGERLDFWLAPARLRDARARARSPPRSTAPPLPSRIRRVSATHVSRFHLRSYRCITRVSPRAPPPPRAAASLCALGGAFTILSAGLREIAETPHTACPSVRR